MDQDKQEKLAAVQTMLEVAGLSLIVAAVALVFWPAALAAGGGALLLISWRLG